jgi:hypothetical protein
MSTTSTTGPGRFHLEVVPDNNAATVSVYMLGGYLESGIAQLHLERGDR